MPEKLLPIRLQENHCVLSCITPSLPIVTWHNIGVQHSLVLYHGVLVYTQGYMYRQLYIPENTSDL